MFLQSKQVKVAVDLKHGVITLLKAPWALTIKVACNHELSLLEGKKELLDTKLNQHLDLQDVVDIQDVYKTSWGSLSTMDRLSADRCQKLT